MLSLPGTYIFDESDWPLTTFLFVRFWLFFFSHRFYISATFVLFVKFDWPLTIVFSLSTEGGGIRASARGAGRGRARQVTGGPRG